jgi:hypothetical protein
MMYGRLQQVYFMLAGANRAGEAEAIRHLGTLLCLNSHDAGWLPLRNGKRPVLATFANPTRHEAGSSHLLGLILCSAFLEAAMS